MEVARGGDPVVRRGDQYGDQVEIVVGPPQPVASENEPPTVATRSKTSNKYTCVVIGYVVWSAWMLLHIVIGSFYFDACPLSSYIPTWLIVQGASSILFVLWQLKTAFCCRGTKEYDVDALVDVRSESPLIYGLVSATILAFVEFIFVYINLEDFNDRDSLPGESCNAILYWYALASSTIQVLCVVAWIATKVYKLIKNKFC